MGCTLITFPYDPGRGVLKEFQSLSTLPENFKGDNTCAEVQVHPSGKFVYASNRRHSSIAGFATDAQPGTLTPIERISTGGRTPRHLAIDHGSK
jgi:6-phosphogluconolactonase